MKAELTAAQREFIQRAQNDPVTAQTVKLWMQAYREGYRDGMVDADHLVPTPDHEALTRRAEAALLEHQQYTAAMAEALAVSMAPDGNRIPGFGDVA